MQFLNLQQYAIGDKYIIGKPIHKNKVYLEFIPDKNQPYIGFYTKRGKENACI